MPELTEHQADVLTALACSDQVWDVSAHDLVFALGHRVYKMTDTRPPRLVARLRWRRHVKATARQVAVLVQLGLVGRSQSAPKGKVEPAYWITDEGTAALGYYREEHGG